MDEQGIRALLEETTGQSKFTLHKGWVMAPCPYAQWRHDKGKDSSPSFGVHVSDGGVSIFNCFTCGSKGTLPTFLRQMTQYTGDDYDAIAGQVEDTEEFMPMMPEWDALAKTRQLEPLVEIPETYISMYDSAVGHPYLKERGITNDDAVRKMELMVDPDSSGVERILFPLRSTDGVLRGFSGRATQPHSVKAKDYFGLQKSRLLLGEHLIEGHDKVVVAEGLFDYAVGWNAGVPTVASMFAGMTEHQLATLLNYNLPVYDFYDNDTAGRRAGNELFNLLKEHVPVLRPVWPNNVKDVGDLHDEELLEMIETARLL